MQDGGDHGGTGTDAFGVTDGWWATDGGWQATDAEARRALRDALGAEQHPDGPPDGPALWFVRRGDTPAVWSPGVLALEDGGEVAVTGALPADLPVGVHELVSDGGHRTQLFVRPSTLPGFPRSWGWTAQVAALRSAGSWGVGDLIDLAALARTAAAQGASVVAHSPLGASTPGTGPQRSPYYPSSRRFGSPLYLRVEDLPGARLAGGTLAAAARAGRRLGTGGRIAHDEAWRLKLSALGAIWDAVGHTPAVRERVARLRTDHGLVTHATFCALAGTHGGGRHTFPAEHRAPGSPGVARFARAEAERVDFWCWVQGLFDDQLASAANAGAALMADLPVGFDPDGSDAWADQELLADGCRIGAPPDDFAPLGQDWGLPPYVPWRLRAAAYGPWRDTLRRVLQHAGSLRIDHVMGLFRLYLVPPGADARHGAYVRQFATELLDVACIEAHRAGAVLVGEDLGTVEPEVRAALAERGVYGYRVGWFEDAPPGEWPARTVGMLSTHDLPTIAGLWSGTDAADRDAAARPPDPDGDALLRARLARLAGEADDATSVEVAVAAHAALAAAGSDLVLAQLEDAVGEEHRVNLPGTIDEHPNWRGTLPVPLEGLAAATSSVADALRNR
ncbi:MAG: 4-alpha-glucanotransferase [Microthrixaceae bacterium]